MQNCITIANSSSLYHKNEDELERSLQDGKELNSGESNSDPDELNDGKKPLSKHKKTTRC